MAAEAEVAAGEAEGPAGALGRTNSLAWTEVGVVTEAAVVDWAAAEERIWLGISDLLLPIG